MAAGKPLLNEQNSPFLTFFSFFSIKINHFLSKMFVCLKNALLLSGKSLTTKILTMNKVELINAVAEKAGMTKVDARKAIDAVLDVTKNELKNDGKIVLVGFGTLGVTNRPAREGRNPRTGKTIKIDAKKVVRFKPAANILQ